MNKLFVSDEIDTFDWESYANESNRLIENKQIKKHPDDNKSRVYCHGQYAQNLYDAYFESNIQLVVPEKGLQYKGKVIQKSENFATVDIGWREMVYVDLKKEEKTYLDNIKLNSEIEIIIKEVNGRKTNNFNLLGSYSDFVKKSKEKEIFESIGKKIAYNATVVELIEHGGYFLDIDGIRVFMPGSLGGVNKLVDFKELVGKSLIVMPINYSKDKNYIVVSRRDYLKTLIPNEVSKLEIGNQYSGFVTGTTEFGIFVEFNSCLTGMIHKSDLDIQDSKKFKNKTIKPGDEIKFNLKDIIDNSRLVLTQKEVIIEKNPWDDIEKRYKVPSVVVGKIKKVARYGIFIEIEPNVVGLLHKSDYEDLNLSFEVGEDITVNLYKIDKDSMKLYFNL